MQYVTYHGEDGWSNITMLKGAETIAMIDYHTIEWPVEDGRLPEIKLSFNRGTPKYSRTLLEAFVVSIGPAVIKVDLFLHMGKPDYDGFKGVLEGLGFQKYSDDMFFCYSM